MKRIVLYGAALATVMACSRPSPFSNGNGTEDPQDTLTTVTSHYNDDLYDQGHTEACWIYAMLACIETERIEHYGDSVLLSADWLIDALRKEETLRHRMLQAHSMRHPFGGADKGMRMRGMGPDALRLIEHYGLIPEKIRPGREDGFYLYGMHYTPRQFAGSVYQKGDWIWYTSFTHHNYGETFALEVPDNHHYNEFMNIPPDSLLAITVRSIERHHPVFWEGTMKKTPTSACPKLAEGLSSSSTTRIARLRQSRFESAQLTDDHAMAIVGMKTDCPTPYFIIKNSWGEKWGKKGYGKMTFEDFLLRTIAIGVR